jgi:hypothetical protein
MQLLIIHHVLHSLHSAFFQIENYKNKKYVYTALNTAPSKGIVLSSRKLLVAETVLSFSHKGHTWHSVRSMDHQTNLNG